MINHLKTLDDDKRELYNEEYMISIDKIVNYLGDNPFCVQI